MINMKANIIYKTFIYLFINIYLILSVYRCLSQQQKVRAPHAFLKCWVRLSTNMICQALFALFNLTVNILRFFIMK